MISLTDLKHIKPKGEGYFCTVTEVVNESTGEHLALKRLKKQHHDNEEYRYRLLREIKLLGQLTDSENIIELVGHANDHETKELWYLMPFAPFNLHNFIKKNNQKLSVEMRFEIIDQIILAIKYAHSKNILHRDLSPNNVLIFKGDEGIRIKVSDFGLGKDTESLSYYTNSSVSGYGQILYVSPEQRNQLKDATIQSDIYSLGKLIYHVFTGKDPDNLKPFELSSLVNKATEEIPSERYENIEKLEAHYLALKELVLDKSVPIEYLTLGEILTSKDIIDTIKLHELLVKGNYSSHVYSDYIAPVNKYMLAGQNLENYYKEVGSNIREFARTYTDRLHECYQTLRWPFSEMGTFGKVLAAIVKIVSDEETKLICLKNLWYLAYEMDQWAVQPLIKRVLTKKHISPKIETQLAEYIMSLETEMDMEQFSQLDIPQAIKKSILTSHEAAIKKKEELEKKRNEELGNIDW